MIDSLTLKTAPRQVRGRGRDLVLPSGAVYPLPHRLGIEGAQRPPVRISNNVPEGSYMTRLDPSAVFVDWLSLTQKHDRPEGQRLPVVAGEFHYHVDVETRKPVLERTTPKQVSGSWRTSVQVKCDGETVSFSGNPGRWGRPDNVFGFSASDVVGIVNRLLADLGLPSFTADARVTTVHLTRNYSVGSRADAMAWIASASCLRPDRENGRGVLYPNGTACDYFRGSRRKYIKLYLKSTELLDNKKRRKGARTVDALAEGHNEEQAEHAAYIKRLADWCDSIGLVRVEVCLFSRYLTQCAVNTLGEFLEADMSHFFRKETAFLSRNVSNVHRIGLDDFRAALLSAYPDWTERKALFHARLAQAYYNGETFANVNKETRKRYRRLLAVLGIDITAPLNVAAMPVRVRVIETRPVEIPVFYRAA